MNVLIKPNQYSKWMRSEQASGEQVRDLILNPLIVKDKDKAPLAIWGNMVQEPELDPESRKPRCTGSNIDSIYCLQLDYDSGLSIEQFCESYDNYRWTLYTSYSYGFKQGDRFRVIVPLAHPLPCYLLNNRRVKDNINWWWGHPDPCCADRGHWQILPCRRSADAPYRYVKSQGTDLWGSQGWGLYEEWVRSDLAAEARRREEARARAEEVDEFQLLADLEQELACLQVGAGTRYAEVKRLLAKYAHKGLGPALLGVSNPWPTEKKWEKRWENLINWASTLSM